MVRTGRIKPSRQGGEPERAGPGVRGFATHLTRKCYYLYAKITAKFFYLRSILINLIEPLTPERFRELWSRTYNTEGKPDWSHIFPYYHEEIVFQDSIQRIEGIEAFSEMCARLTTRCEQLNMEILSIATNPGEIFFEWKMVMIFNKKPPTPLYGCSKLTIGPDNRIIHQRDYFDMWGDIFNNIPYFHKPYRRFMHRHFG